MTGPEGVEGPERSESGFSVEPEVEDKGALRDTIGMEGLC